MSVESLHVIPMGYLIRVGSGLNTCHRVADRRLMDPQHADLEKFL